MTFVRHDRFIQWNGPDPAEGRPLFWSVLNVVQSHTILSQRFVVYSSLREKGVEFIALVDLYLILSFLLFESTLLFS